MRLTIVARADLTGLGNQSRNWVRLLNPNKVIVINSKPFNGNEQHFEWYEGRKNAFRVEGFIKSNEINPILNDTDVLLMFESTYNYNILSSARGKGVKTVLQNNWEFTDYIVRPTLPFPDLLVNHSYWHLDEQRGKWPNITEYCPTPIFIEDYDSIYQQNIERTGKKRILHIAGRTTYKDRNGTEDLLAAIKLIPKEVDFELVIKSQTVEASSINDPRVVIDHSQPVDEKELYRGFDFVAMPRRYGGACLPMTEALAAGLPVIMTDIDPNNKILPEKWLVKSKKKEQFKTRGMIDVYSADLQVLANKIVELISDDLDADKKLAREIAVKEYSSEAVLEKWALLMEKLGV